MPNLLFVSDNASFAEDLCGQIKYYAPEFNILAEDGGGILDIVVLDDKPELLKEFRAKHPKTPVFLLLSEADEIFESSNLNITVAKPLQLDAFLNQLRAGSNLLDNSADGYLHFNRYELRPVAREILNLRNNEIVKLTEKEVAIIKYLYKARDKIVAKNELFQEYVADAAKELGADIKIKDFVCFKLGEGLQKKEEDFAAEVASQLKK